MKTILRNLGYTDIGIEKARGEGATWMCLYIFIWRWLFYDTQFFGIVSRNEAAADSPDDPDSLGAKIDWALAMLPTWLCGEKDSCWKRKISQHTWVRRKGLNKENVLPEDFAGAAWKSEDNGNSITAYPTTGELMSGGRKLAIMLDEFAKHERGPDAECLASTEPVTNCRILVSTYWGMHGAYYEAMRNSHLTNMVKVQLKWTDNPYRNKNLFRIETKKKRLLSAHNQDVELTNSYAKEFWKKDSYFDKLQRRGYDVANPRKVWSPWYIDRCLRPGMDPQNIAQEYDIDPIGSGNSFFEPTMIEAKCEHCRQPSFIGNLEIDHEQCALKGLMPQHTGVFRMWLNYNDHENWRPPPANYIIGADIAMGLGSARGSNSVLSIVNLSTGQKVAEYASSVVAPEKFAEVAIAVCRFFTNNEGDSAYLIWESNGGGRIFQQRIIQSNFRNFYWRKPYEKTRRKATKEPGWWSTADSKRALLGKYRYSLDRGYFSNPSEIALRECLQYQQVDPRRIEFVGLMGIADPSNAGENHGDRVIADALANYAMEELGGGPTATIQARSTDPPDGSFGARQKKRRLDQMYQNRLFWGERDPRKLKRW